MEVEFAPHKRQELFGRYRGIVDGETSVLCRLLEMPTNEKSVQEPDGVSEPNRMHLEPGPGSC